MARRRARATRARQRTDETSDRPAVIAERVARQREEVARLCEENPDPERPPVQRRQRLLYPVENAGQMIWEITWNYPTFRDLRDVGGMAEEEALEHVLLELTELHRDAIQQLSAVDLEEAQEIFLAFRERRSPPSNEEQP
jgi:hypothetical protein